MQLYTSTEVAKLDSNPEEETDSEETSGGTGPRPYLDWTNVQPWVNIPPPPSEISIPELPLVKPKARMKRKQKRAKEVEPVRIAKGVRVKKDTVVPVAQELSEEQEDRKESSDQSDHSWKPEPEDPKSEEDIPYSEYVPSDRKSTRLNSSH